MEAKQIIIIVLYTVIVELLTILVYKLFANPKRRNRFRKKMPNRAGGFINANRRVFRKNRGTCH